MVVVVVEEAAHPSSAEKSAGKLNDVVEAIEENYQGTLNNSKINEQDLSRFILIQKLEEELFEKDDEKRIRFVYKVIVKDNEVAKTLIESWYLAFRHAVYDQVQVRIQKVQKI